MLWHEQSWPAIRELEKKTPVVVPIASCEQHGHHLPVFVDSIQVTSIAERVEKTLGDRVLLTPTLWLGSSHHHNDFPGTISVRPSLFSEMIKDVARSILRAGFRRIFFLNGHGGNVVPGSQALSELVAEDDGANESFLVLASWWDACRDVMGPEHQGTEQAGVIHACEYETSLILMLRPDLVDMDKVRPAGAVLDNAWFASDSRRASRVNVFGRFNRWTAHGFLGKPEAATAAKGQSIFDAVTDHLTEFLGEFADWPELPAIGPSSPPHCG